MSDLKPELKPESKPELKSDSKQGESKMENKINSATIPQKLVPKQPSSLLPWVEKYRPQVLSDVLGNEESVHRLIDIASTNEMPYLLLAGPSGTGKTTSLKCFAREILGENATKAVLIINASDERHSKGIRDRVRGFVKLSIKLLPGQKKLVIMDEADNMTTSAQKTLIRIMADSEATTRFALACNYPNKIQSEITKRCTMLRFERLEDNRVLRRIMRILELEQIDPAAWTVDGLKTILYTAQGDMRQAIGNLEATYVGTGSITTENVLKTVDQPHPFAIQTILHTCIDVRLADALGQVNILMIKGHDPLDILNAMFIAVKHLSIHDDLMASLVSSISHYHSRIINGSSVASLQLDALLSSMCRASRMYKSTLLK